MLCRIHTLFRSVIDIYSIYSVSFFQCAMDICWIHSVSSFQDVVDICSIYIFLSRLNISLSQSISSFEIGYLLVPIRISILKPWIYTGSNSHPPCCTTDTHDTFCTLLSRCCKYILDPIHILSLKCSWISFAKDIYSNVVDVRLLECQRHSTEKRWLKNTFLRFSQEREAENPWEVHIYIYEISKEECRMDRV